MLWKGFITINQVCSKWDTSFFPFLEGSEPLLLLAEGRPQCIMLVKNPRQTWNPVKMWETQLAVATTGNHRHYYSFNQASQGSCICL